MILVLRVVDSLAQEKLPFSRRRARYLVLPLEIKRRDNSKQKRFKEDHVPASADSVNTLGAKLSHGRRATKLKLTALADGVVATT